ncbi:GNAT family N-acetyltransferase [Streptomyces sp. NPDC048644]|uniref:GNAT family N-acetyltransferase n=1 Tax=Streptomyces sp. NPDC048644 TaxID=3365582 RepID=UPI0037194730
MPASPAPALPPLPYTPAHPLRTERLDLRPVTLDDTTAIHAYRSLPEVCRYLYSNPIDETTAHEAVTAQAARTTLRTSGDVLQLAVAVRETGHLIGDVTFVLTSTTHRQGGIGYVFHPAHSGHGYATEAARALLKIGFEDLRLHRIQAELDGRNTASARPLERLGMRREGHLRENEFLDGEWTDEVIYALLADEWRALRAPEDRRPPAPSAP